MKNLALSILAVGLWYLSDKEYYWLHENAPELRWLSDIPGILALIAAIMAIVI